ncbi:MAG: glycosyltransferase family 2 protein [Candidatus Hydrogenedentes bacterium]|nr:glycosyltransferase family 2 protein [Candidatus Hydrogenedentota bacterium]
MCLEGAYSRAKEKSNVVVIIPCYNAGERLKRVIEGVLNYPFDVLVVDDGSTDGCIDTLVGYPISLLSFPENRGKGWAIIEGLKKALVNANYDAFCFLDADYQHDPSLLPEFLRIWSDTNADLVIGQRDFKSGKVPLASKVGNIFTKFMLKFFVKCPIEDTQCGYRLYSRKFAQMIAEKIKPGRYETETEILLLALEKRLKIVTIAIPTLYEKGNVSSHFRKFYDSFRILKSILKNLI